ncbi:histidine kinase dimerization/phosphoacceptor domain -containing protein [Desulfohalovibrio reitneri]|uniref:histidine kinase dimerization/phosphoacceptor domain -containing protein n=1 Tax=Desulfohalovibrio reitneri TaxID=1307759 RepID=UPI0006912AB0|nr:histidine kinase dimerization/phosphoacceptor domain -containing protein [Desulfohalovibrio reitneri]
MTEEEIKAAFGKRLRRLRLRSLSTQAGLAEQTGISEEYLSKIERGLASPSFAVMGKLAERLGVSLDALFRFSPEGTSDGDLDPASLLELAFDNLSLGLFLSNPDGRFLAVNTALARMFGYESAAQFRGSVTDIPHDIYLDPMQRGRILDELPRDGRLRSHIVSFRRLDGGMIRARMHIGMVCVRDTGILYGAVERLSDQDLAEPPAEYSNLVSKQFLKETHHRIKNNLNMLCSYLNLRMSEEDCAPCLREAIVSLRAAARVHEVLYTSQSVSTARLDSYLDRLTEALRESSIARTDIAVRLECQCAELPWESLSVVGMVVTELFVNAAKHAFPDDFGDEPEVVIRCFEGENVRRVEVEDNGVGLPHDIDPASAETIGFSVMRAMAEQIGADLWFFTSTGTKAVLDF